jgi:hypothetical protein
MRTEMLSGRPRNCVKKDLEEGWRVQARNVRPLMELDGRIADNRVSDRFEKYENS